MIKETKIYKELERRESQYINNIDEITKYAENTLPKINKIFSEYTSHDIEHSKRIIEYMYCYINNIEKLSDLELTALIYCALLHDIGMVVTDEEVEELKKDNIELCGVKYSKVKEKYNNDNIALQECFRPVHGLRSKKIIEEIDEKLFIIPNYTQLFFRDEIAEICQSHNEDYTWIRTNLKQYDVKGKDNFNAQYIAILLRLSDIIDIDEKRTPYYLYRIINPKEISDIEWKQHFIIQNTEKIIFNEETNFKSIVFHGVSNNPEVHRKILKYMDWINEELKLAIIMSEEFLKKEYLIKIKPYVENKIETKGFSFSDFKLTLDLL